MDLRQRVLIHREVPADSHRLKYTSQQIDHAMQHSHGLAAACTDSLGSPCNITIHFSRLIMLCNIIMDLQHNHRLATYISADCSRYATQPCCKSMDLYCTAWLVFSDLRFYCNTTINLQRPVTLCNTSPWTCNISTHLRILTKLCNTAMD